MDIPEELKYLTPYIQRGQELATREPIISYYAQYYAVKLAISRGPSNKTTNAYLSHLLDTLEEKKKTLGVDNEVITNDLVGYAHVENFALKVFLSADNEDRSGGATKRTAKTFLASSVFLELLKVFGDIDAETEGKIKYAKWKAADIMKAIREGRTPTPGAPGENENEDIVTPNLATTADVDTEDTTPLQSQSRPLQPPAISDFPSPPSNFTESFSVSSPTVVNNEKSHIPQPPTQPSVSSFSSSASISPTTSTSLNQNFTSNHISSITPSSSSRVPTTVATPTPDQSVSSTINQSIGPREIEAAQKSAKWAISALNYDDIATARLQLLNALNDLGFNLQNNFGY